MKAAANLFDCRVEGAALEKLQAIFRGGQLAIGPQVQALEEDLGSYIGCRNVVAMGDATHALTLALQLAGVGPGDEVLTLAYNCLSSTTAVTATGAIPVWVDIDADRASMSMEDARAAVSPRAKALVVYHVAGYPSDVFTLRSFCDEMGLALIEDANNALGASWNGAKVGTVGDFGVYSFYANRQVNGIEGAALVCKDEGMAQKAKRLRRFGVDKSSYRDRLGEINPASDVPQIGMSSAMNHVNATLARHNLSSLNARLARNRSNVNALVAATVGVDTFRPITVPPEANPAFWVWLVRSQRRDELMRKLKEAGIHCSTLHYPNNRYSGFPNKRKLPHTEKFMGEVLAIPCGWWLAATEIDQIANGIAAALKPAA